MGLFFMPFDPTEHNTIILTCNTGSEYTINSWIDYAINTTVRPVEEGDMQLLIAVSVPDFLDPMF